MELRADSSDRDSDRAAQASLLFCPALYCTALCVALRVHRHDVRPTLFHWTVEGIGDGEERRGEGGSRVDIRD